MSDSRARRIAAATGVDVQTAAAFMLAWFKSFKGQYALGDYMDAGEDAAIEKFGGKPETRDPKPDVEAFLVEIVEVCQRHGLSLSNEDGRLQITDYADSLTDRLLLADRLV